MISCCVIVYDIILYHTGIIPVSYNDILDYLMLLLQILKHHGARRSYSQDGGGKATDGLATRLEVETQSFN